MKVNMFRLPKGILDLFATDSEGLMIVDENQSHRSDRIIKDVYGVSDIVKDAYLNNFNNTSNLRITANSRYIIIADKLIEDFGAM